MFTKGAKRSTSPRENKREELVEQYKPLGLKAVLAAAIQSKPKKAKAEKRELPAGLRNIEAY